MLDIHSHILPGIDDGSKSPEETAQLLTLLQQQGVTTVAATSHFYADRETPDDFLQRRKEALSKLPDTTTVQILPGAEVAYFPGMGNCDAIVPLQIGSTGLLLVEMPFRPWTDRIVADICSIPLQLGLIPVLAHVDRYRQRNQFPKYLRQLLDNDVLFQCNAEAFERGPQCRWALQLVKKGYLHFLGSDCHNLTTRSPKLLLAAQTIEKKLGQDALTQLNSTARRLLSGDDR